MGRVGAHREGAACATQTAGVGLCFGGGGDAASVVEGGGELGRGAGVGVAAGGGGDLACAGVGDGTGVGWTVGTVSAWVGCACGTAVFFVGGRVGRRCGFGLGFSTAAKTWSVSAAEVPSKLRKRSRDAAPRKRTVIARRECEASADPSTQAYGSQELSQGVHYAALHGDMTKAAFVFCLAQHSSSQCAGRTVSLCNISKSINFLTLTGPITVALALAVAQALSLCASANPFRKSFLSLQCSAHHTHHGSVRGRCGRAPSCTPWRP